MSDQRGYKRSQLRDFLVAHYEELKRRLTYRLGNAEVAGDALHDAYVRLQSKGESELADAHIAQPAAYLHRMAFHLAIDRERTVERRLTTAEIDEVLGITDPAPGPAKIAEDRQDLQDLLRDMEALPPRRREILLAVRLDGATREQLAALYGISLRTVDRELEKAYAFCFERLTKDRP
ncbi:sigma-70 family RNA polymerase sigma factor [Steroidobacter sp. S1-65]|uniref:Sigma-70 family RNA polymerase sigma factor n=1 Tax=Steroidobacter gossypii TaxID=2805490 RepID=A0ABS1WZE5_9GAMM|nr:sigma-70 family RNA polymerase sigma factor [Steroidobacter gossypii]MBM0106354.1 sigma-70 family RNA polymerase sigma factor [Steroidobacter gossypii]